MIRWSMRESAVTVLGPGTRSVLWVAGCCFSCPGCVAQHARNGLSTEDTPQAMADWFLAGGQSGLTLSGGEPFLQAADLSEMIAFIRRANPSVSVIIYTGFRLAELQALIASGRHDIASLLDAIDVLIDGRYEEAEHNDGRFGIGSSNQTLINLTGRLPQVELDAYYSSTRARAVEIKAEPDSIKLIGVPDALC